MTAGALVVAINLAMILFIGCARHASPCTTGQAA
jgi:hypothetical protein